MTNIFSTIFVYLLLTMKSVLLLVLAFVCLDAVKSDSSPIYEVFDVKVIILPHIPGSENVENPESAYMYMLQGESKYFPQTGNISELTIQKGLLSSKTHEVAGSLNQQKNQLFYKHPINGTTKIPNTFKDWKKMTFVWNGHKDKFLRVAEITFTPHLDDDYVNGYIFEKHHRKPYGDWDTDSTRRYLQMKQTRSFCYIKPIKSGEKVTFKEC